jgi:flagellar biosynthesis component FlhA
MLLLSCGALICIAVGTWSSLGHCCCLLLVLVIAIIVQSAPKNLIQWHEAKKKKEKRKKKKEKRKKKKEKRKKKKEKNWPMAQETSMTSLGPFFYQSAVSTLLLVILCHLAIIA